MKLYGVSLSFCVLDILMGRIAEDVVGAIYCGFDYEKGIGAPEHYYGIYWKKFPKSEVDGLLARLDIRPAVCEHQNISQGHWMIGEPTPIRMMDQDDRHHVPFIGIFNLNNPNSDLPYQCWSSVVDGLVNRNTSEIDFADLLRTLPLSETEDERDSRLADEDAGCWRNFYGWDIPEEE